MAEDAAVAGDGARRRTEIVDKWGDALLARGFVALPSLLLEHQHRLGLTPVDVNIVAQLTRYWIDADELPYPTMSTIASAMGVHPRTVRRRVAALKAAGYVKLQPGKSRRTGRDIVRFDLRPLIETATAVSKMPASRRDGTAPRGG